MKLMSRHNLPYLLAAALLVPIVGKTTTSPVPVDPTRVPLLSPMQPPAPATAAAAAGAAQIDNGKTIPKPKIYKPKIFKTAEFQTLKVLTETILRDDEMPGAREAKANEFIDFQIAYDPEIQDRFHEGLAWLDQHARKLYGKRFATLALDERKEIIQCLEIKAKHRPGEELGREFYELARRYTYMGFYASEEALKVAIPNANKKPVAKRRRLAITTESEASKN